MSSKEQAKETEKPYKGAKLITTRLADVEAKELKWLWPNRIPMGKLTLIVGEAGLGKSLLTVYIAAIVTTGRPWIDIPKENTTKGNVILLTAEDDLNDTVRPRMDAAGADPNKVLSTNYVGVAGKDNGHKFFSLRTGEHLVALYEKIEEIDNVRLVIIDPITAYFAMTDTHKNTEVRAVLHPLCKVAERTGVAIVGISHLNKDTSMKAIHRPTGSTAFVDAARAVWGVAKDKDDNNRRLLVPVKANLSSNPTSLAFRLVSFPANVGKLASVVCSFEPHTFYMTADEAMSTKSSDKRSEKPAPKLDKAVGFLRGILVGGPKKQEDIENIATQQGIRKSALKKAKKSIGVRSDKYGVGKEQYWEWRLPTEEERLQDAIKNSEEAYKRAKIPKDIMERLSKNTGSP